MSSFVKFHCKEVLGELKKKKKGKFLIYSNHSKHVHDFNFKLGQLRFKALPCHLLAVSPQASYITAQSQFPHLKIEVMNIYLSGLPHGLSEMTRI